MIIKKGAVHSCVSEWRTLPMDSSEAACYLTVCLAKVSRLGGWVGGGGVGCRALK